MDVSFDAEWIFSVADDERVAFMSSACSKHRRPFVNQVFRPFLSYSLQHPNTTAIPLLLRRFLDEVDSDMRCSLVRIGLDDLEQVLVVSRDDSTACFCALETFLATCPMDVTVMGTFIERLTSIDFSKNIRKQLLHLVYRSDLCEAAKQEYFIHAVQMEPTSHHREQALMYLQKTNFGNPAALHVIVKQLRDKAKRVHMAAFDIITTMDPVVESLDHFDVVQCALQALLHHLGADTMAQCLGVLAHLANARDESHHAAIGRMLVVYATHPSHTLERTCDRLTLLDKYHTDSLDALVREKIDQLVLPSFFQSL